MPVFAPDGGPALVLARGFTVASLLSISGTLTFRGIVLPRAFHRMSPELLGLVDDVLLRWLRLSMGLAGLTACVWLVILTSGLATPRTVVIWVADAWTVLTDTDFGHVILLQMLAIIAARMVLGRTPSSARWRVALVPGTAAVLLQVGHGHAYAMANGVSYLETSEALHLWAAGAWLGGLVPLLLVVLAAPPSVAATAARWFSPLGKLCVAVLAVSAFVQTWVLIGSTKALIHTSYGWVASLKFALFGVLLGYAILNRYWLAPGLLGSNPIRARRWLVGSLACQTGFGLLIVLAASLLGQLRPGLDLLMPR